MDSVLDDLARAVRRLTEAGIEHYVLSADHGYLFAHGDRDESMRVDDPAARGRLPPALLDRQGRRDARRLHPGDRGRARLRLGPRIRVPAGRGRVPNWRRPRVPPRRPSLQEMVIPVVTVRTQQAAATSEPADKLAVTNLPYEINNRMFSITVSLGQAQPRPILGRPRDPAGGPERRHAGRQGGHRRRGGARPGSGIVTLQPGKPATIGFLLIDDGLDAVRIVVRRSGDRRCRSTPRHPTSRSDWGLASR